MMIGLAIVVVYLVGWVLASAAGMRVLADRMPKCERGTAVTARYRCGCLWNGHWRGDGTIGRREGVFAAWAGLGWPILWLPFVAYLLANRRPTPRALENHIADLEREAGIR